MNARAVAASLREIVGQETEPPLWIYVTKDQVPTLLAAAELIERGQVDAFVDGFCCCGFMYTEQNQRFLATWDRYAPFASKTSQS
jgi:hypothetical protein